jgi:hypothetical protein
MKKSMPEDKSSVRERERQAVELRNARMTYQDIADRVGYSGPGAAREAVLRCYQRDIVQNVEEIRNTELATLDAMAQALYPKARRGDEKAVEALLKVMKERRKYIGGLEVPAQMDVTVEHTDSDTFSKQLDAYLQGKADAYEQEKA